MLQKRIYGVRLTDMSWCERDSLLLLSRENFVPS